MLLEKVRPFRFHSRRAETSGVRRDHENETAGGEGTGDRANRFLWRIDMLDYVEEGNHVARSG